MVRRGQSLCPSGSILLSSHYDPLSSRPAARRVLARLFPECPAAPDRNFVIASHASTVLMGLCGMEYLDLEKHTKFVQTLQYAVPFRCSQQ